MRQVFRLLLLLLTVAAVLPRALAQPPADPAAGGAPEGPPAGVRAFTADAGRWAWLRTAGGETELVLGGPGREPVAVARGAGWTDVALAGEEAWLLAREAGTVLRVPLAPGAAPAAAASGREHPEALLAAGDRLYWLETLPEAQPGFAFIPPLGPRARLCCREPDGEIRTLAEWPAGQQQDPDFPAGELLGTAGENLYFTVRRRLSTDFLRIPLAGGEPELLAGEPGIQEGVLRNGELFWTAPSEEATPFSGIRCARRLENGAPVTVAEWLPARGGLHLLEGELYYLSDALYRLPREPGLPQPIRPLPGGRLATDGRRVLSLEGDAPAPL